MRLRELGAAGVLALSGCAVKQAVGPAAPEPATMPPASAPSAVSAAPSRAGARTPASSSDPPAAPRRTPHCPQEMALVERLRGAYCVDRWEASIERLDGAGRAAQWASNRPVDGIEREIRALSAAGRKPQGYISGAQAAVACARAGKRLCEIDEWVRACKGPEVWLYPYGNTRRPNVCNDRFKVLDHHPVVTLFNRHAPPGTDRRLMWHPSWMNDPRLHEMEHTIDPSGSHAGCTNEYGVYDMVGNLHEWVADPDGTFMGGFFMDTFQNGQGCEYRTIAHEFEYHDYSTGFRCCADAAS